MIAAKRNLVECAHCGAFNRLPPGDRPGRLFCYRCDHRLHRHRPQWSQHALVCVVTGLILFLLSNTQPFISLEMADQVLSTTLLSGVQALLSREEVFLAGLLLLSIFLLPLMQLLTLLYLLLSRLQARAMPASRYGLALLLRFERWNMLEVFLLGVLVTIVKLSDVAQVVPGAGLYSFLAVVLLLNAAGVLINRRQLWQQIDGNDYFVLAGNVELSGCSVCNALVDQRLRYCPRCHSRIARRQLHSLQRTWGFLAAAIVLYIPANTLPMMYTTSFGATRSDTILSGAHHLLVTGQWPIALIVFVASILVPIGKIVVLLYLLVRAHRPTPVRLMHRLRLYRVTEFVGRWSMVDVYVVILMMALVQFGVIANIEPGGAALSFGCVVVLTMLAAESFDPRLLWEGVDETASG